MRRGSISSLLAAGRESKRETEKEGEGREIHVGEKNTNASHRQGEIHLYVEKGITAVALNYSRNMVTWNWPNDYDYDSVLSESAYQQHKYRPTELYRNIFQK